MMVPFLKEAVKNLFSKPSTVEYPFKVKESPAKPGYRGRIAYDPSKCIGCGMCMKVCSPSAIVEIEKEVEGGKEYTRIFDLTSCTFCETCADFCDEGAIKLTEDYHMVAENAEDLVVKGTRFVEATSKQVACDSESCVYCTLCAKKCPQGAITVDRASKNWTIDHEKCVQCGICISGCPKKALKMEEAAAPQVTFHDDACVYCTLCAKKCPQGAINVDRANKNWEIDREKCVQCGICVKGCPKKALTMEAPTDCQACQCAEEQQPVAAPEAVAPAQAVEAPVEATTTEAPAAENAATPEAVAPAAEPGVNFNGAACVYCTLCARKCPQEAITVDRANKSWEIDREKCIQCGVCVDGCPKNALSMNA